MEPLSLASSFATIVGLIGMFRQESKDKDSMNKEAFLQWLESHRHEELSKYIRSSQKISAEIERALKEDHEIILDKLNKIDDLLSTLSKNINIFGGLAELLHPSEEISDQAVDIIRQLVTSPSTEFINHKSGSTTDALILMQGGGNIGFEEPRFINDDLDTSVRYGLLRLRYGSKGSEIYGITRNAVKLIENFDH